MTALPDAIIVLSPDDPQCEELFLAYFGEARGIAQLFRWDGPRPRWIRVVHLERVPDGWRFDLMWPFRFEA